VKSALRFVLAVMAAATVAWAQTAAMIRVTAARANVRAAAAVDAPVIEQATEGTLLELVGEEGAWFQVRVPPNPQLPGVRAIGYISKTVARLATAAEMAAAAEAVRQPVAKPPGGSIGIAADHAGVTTWLKATGTRAVPVVDPAMTPRSMAASPALIAALGPAGTGASEKTGAPDVIWAWVTPADALAPVLTGRHPSFFVSYRDIPGLDPNEWTPGVVRLQPIEGTTWRLVSAASGPADARTRADAHWTVLNDLAEQSSRVSLSGSGPGVLRMTLTAALEPGEYAVVIRPAFAVRRYTGRRLLGNEGEGVAFGAAWIFAVR
jgi:hypothetical protein